MALAVQELNNDVPYIGHCCIWYKTTNQEGIMSKPKYTTAQKCSQRYLRTIRLAERKIQVLEAEIELQQSRLSLNGVEGGENVSQTLAGDAQEQGFVQLYELCETLDNELIRYTKDRDEGMKVLENLESPIYYELLYLRYFQGLRNPEISRIMYRSESQINEDHKRALSAIYRFIPREFKQARR